MTTKETAAKNLIKHPQWRNGFTVVGIGGDEPESRACYGFLAQGVGGVGYSLLSNATVMGSVDQKEKDLWHRVAPKFYEWLMCPETSPFRELVKGNPPFEVTVGKKTYVVNSPQFAYEHGIVLYNTKFPSNYLVAFLMMTRSLNEGWRNAGQLMAHLIDKGYHPGVAYVFGHSLSANGAVGTSVYSTRHVQYHGCAVIPNAGAQYWENFLNGVIVNGNANYSECANYWRHNSPSRTWGKGGTRDLIRSLLANKELFTQAKERVTRFFMSFEDLQMKKSNSNSVDEATMLKMADYCQDIWIKDHKGATACAA